MRRAPRDEPPTPERLRDLRAPGESDARRRAWELAATALEERAPAAGPRRSPLLRRPALATAALVALLLAAFSPPGSAVAGWLGDAMKSVVDDDDPPPRRASGLEDLPGGGRVLVLADGAPWMAGDAGRRRLAGSVDDATWSPGGRFVATVRGNQPVAVDLRGNERWSLTAPAPIAHARWSPDGFRVAYATGAEMRLVAGDGTGDRVVTQRRVRGADGAFAGLAWRPGAGHVLAYVDRRRVWVVDTDRRRVLWSTRAPRDARPEFSPDGRRLLLVAPGEVRVLAALGGERAKPSPRLGGAARELQRIRAKPGTRFGDGAWDRASRRFAVVRRRGPQTEVLVAVARRSGFRFRRMFAAGDLRVVAFSPDDRWLLVDWTETGTWLFVPTNGGRARQLPAVAPRFGAKAVTPQGWCCPP